eukprot:6231433-Pyramimonas_sp.AAC.1
MVNATEYVPARRVRIPKSDSISSRMRSRNSVELYSVCSWVSGMVPTVGAAVPLGTNTWTVQITTSMLEWVHGVVARV